MGVALKRCGHCKRDLPIDNFSRNRSCTSGLSSYCRECKRKSDAKDYQLHSETRKEHVEKWRRANRDKHRAQGRIYYYRNRSRRKKRQREIERKYYQQPAVYRRKLDREGEYRARKLKTTTERISRAAVHRRSKGICHICKKWVSLRAMHVEHVVPLSRGGTHTYKNVRASHKRCNLSKGAKLMKEL